MKLGYMARDQYGQTIHLTDPDKHPKGQLLDKLGRKHAERIYNDGTESTVHTGYIVAGSWWTIYEVHGWEGKA
jgi:hypothetical protein